MSEPSPPATPSPDESAELPTSDCSICRHADAATIDAGLLAGTPLRTLAETHTVSRSALGRHKTNHLTLQTITDPPPVEGREPLRMVDVHAQLAALVDRLEDVVALASRTRKAPAAIAAMRELRQVLEAIARIQADPELQKAAGLAVLEAEVNKISVDTFTRMLDFVLAQFGFEQRMTNGARTAERERLLWHLLASCLRELTVHGVGTRFSGVDTSAVREFVERQALERTARLEAEVERRVAARVDAELRRREALLRPAIEARPVLEIEGSTAWTT